MMLKQRSLLKDKVFVALPEEPGDGKSILSWVIDHASDNTEIIIHIVTVPDLGSKKQNFDKYLDQCSRKKVKAEERTFFFMKIDDGLVHLINIYGITKLVMGAASDKYYCRKMKTPESHTAISVMEKSHPYCNIWFICNRKLIFVREANSCLITKSKSARLPCAADDANLDVKYSLQSKIEAKRWEQMYINEMKLRKEVEAKLSQEKVETEALKQATVMLQKELDWFTYEWNENVNRLQEVNQQKRCLEHSISESNSVASHLEESIRATESLAQSLKLEYSKVKQERDDALKEARDMRIERELMAPCSYGATSTEFSLMELDQANQNLNSSL